MLKELWLRILLGLLISCVLTTFAFLLGLPWRAKTAFGRPKTLKEQHPSSQIGGT